MGAISDQVESLIEDYCQSFVFFFVVVVYLMLSIHKRITKQFEAKVGYILFQNINE